MKILFICMAIISFQTFAADDEQAILKLQGLSIVGEKELPKVLYIVPWEGHEATKITAPNYKSVLDDDFSFIKKPNITQ